MLFFFLCQKYIEKPISKPEFGFRKTFLASLMKCLAGTKKKKKKKPWKLTCKHLEFIHAERCLDPVGKACRTESLECFEST